MYINSERWRDIEGYEGLYQVSNLGKVRSLDRFVKGRYGDPWFYPGKIMKIRKDKKGYRQICLCKLGKKKQNLVHRLVATAFLPNDENKSEVNHKDGNKMNNKVYNLEWATTSENQIHAFRAGLHKPTMTGKTGSKHPQFKGIVYVIKDGICIDELHNPREYKEKGYDYTCVCRMMQGMYRHHRGCQFTREKPNL